jgi:valyl-tRNA synthetase
VRWPQESDGHAPQAEEAFGRLQELVRAIRNVRSEYDVPAGRKIAALVSAGDQVTLLVQNLSTVAMLARLDASAVQIAAELAAPGQAAVLAVAGMTVYLPMAGLVDLAAERKRTQEEIDNVDRLGQRIEGMLANPGFVGKAPAEVVERERARLAELQERRSRLTERLAELAV